MTKTRNRKSQTYSQWRQLSLFQEPTKEPKPSRLTPSDEKKSSKKLSRKPRPLPPVVFPNRVHTTNADGEKLIAVSAKGIPIGEDGTGAKYSDWEVDCVFACREAGWTYREIAAHLDMPRSTVHAICTGKIRETVPDHYKQRKK